MTIRTVSFTAILLAGLAAPCLAQEATLPPHSLDLDKSVEPESIVIQDLSGGVGSQDGGSGGGGNVIVPVVLGGGQPPGNGFGAPPTTVWGNPGLGARVDPPARVVPEPGMLVLFALGLALVALVTGGRRRR